MPPPFSMSRTNRASFSTTHQPTLGRRRRHASSHPPLSLVGVPWRFLHFTADSGAGLPPVLSEAGRQYMAEDAYRWQTQQTAGDVIATIPQLAPTNTQPLRLSAYGDGSREEAHAEAGDEDDEEEDDGATREIAPLPEFNPFSDTFAVALSPIAQHASSVSSTHPPTERAAEAEVEEGYEPTKKKRGMVAADLLSHFAQKEVVDEERERTRKRERSKWENNNTTHGAHNGGTSAGASHSPDSGGVMVGGLGLSDESNSARQARLAVDAEEEERRRRLSAAAEDEGLTAADMPDMSDFIKLYENEDETSYPAIIWRQKERLTEAADVPPSVITELQTIDRERAAALTKRRGKSRDREGTASRGAKRGHERKMTLRFNLGLGKDYEEENEDDTDIPAAKVGSNKQSTAHSTAKNRFPSLTTAARSAAYDRPAIAAKAPQSLYGRQWYLPVVQWSIAEEEKERLEAATTEAQQQHGGSLDSGTEAADVEADGYHGDGWRDKVLALKAELPQLYCSRAFKAFLLREREKERDGAGKGSGSGGGSRSGRRRLPHYLEAVEALDEKKEEEEQKREIQAAVQAITTPRIAHSSIASTASTRTQSAASSSASTGPLLPLTPTADDVGAASVVGEEEREGDLLEYMREVRMRELNLAGLRWIKEREKAMEERERRKKERERRKARAGSTAATAAVAGGGATSGSGGSEEAGDADEEDEVDLDKLFDVPDYPCSLT